MFLNTKDQNLVWYMCLSNHLAAFKIYSYPSGIVVMPASHIQSFPSSCNIRLQEREPCHPIKFQKDLNSAL